MIRLTHAEDEKNGLTHCFHTNTELGLLWEGSGCQKVSEVKGGTPRLSLGYTMTWSPSSPFGRQLVRCCLLSTPHLYPILTFFFFFLIWWHFKHHAWKNKQVEASEINCVVTGHFGQLHDGKLYRELFKGVFKAVGRVGVGKGALELKSNSSSTWGLRIVEWRTRIWCLLLKCLYEQSLCSDSESN